MRSGALSLRISGWTLILLLAAFLPAQSERKTEIQQPLLQHEVAVTIKLVQVFVMDRKGKPVTDLAKDDFSILDNGQPVSITEFEIHGSHAQSQAAIFSSSTIKPESPIPLLNRKFFLFLDFAYNSQKGADKAVQAALYFVKTVVRPSDEVALVSAKFFGGVTIHEYLTTDHRKVEEHCRPSPLWRSRVGPMRSRPSIGARRMMIQWLLRWNR